MTSKMGAELGRAGSIIAKLSWALTQEEYDPDLELIRISTQPELAEEIASLIMDHLFVPIFSLTFKIDFDSDLETLLDPLNWSLGAKKKVPTADDRAVLYSALTRTTGDNGLQNVHYHMVQTSRPMKSNEVIRLANKLIGLPSPSLVETIQVLKQRRQTLGSLVKTFSLDALYQDHWFALDDSLVLHIEHVEHVWPAGSQLLFRLTNTLPE